MHKLERLRYNDMNEIHCCFIGDNEHVKLFKMNLDQEF